MPALKQRNPIKTYSRQQKGTPKITKPDVEPPPKRRRIDDYFKRAVPARPITPPIPPIVSVTDQRSDGEKPQEGTSSSSPQPEINIFSDESHLNTTPPSSPPRIPSSPIHRIRKPTFSFLSRNGLSKKQRQPLGETSDNARWNKGSRTLTQMKIDLGDEEHKQCPECGMEYLPSNEEDVAIHKRFHASSKGGLELKKAFLEQTKVNRIWENGSGTCILVITANDGVAARRKTVSVLEIVTSELGAVPIPEDELWSSSRVGVAAERKSKGRNEITTDGNKGARNDRFKAFLYVHDQKCVGMCLAERISQAYPVLSAEEAEDAKEGNLQTESSSISVGSTAEKVLMGVSRIWTSSAHRRMGIAQTLLDTAADNFLYGMEVPKQQVAFSQPTESGGKLARSWFGRDHGWHVYLE